MRHSILAFMLFVASTNSAFAGSRSVSVSQTNADQTVVVTDAVGHTEYRQVYINRTCSRSVLDGYRTECRIVRDENCSIVNNRECHIVNGQKVCRDIPTRVCHPIDRRECHQVAVYRTEYYDCSYYDTVAVHVHDYNTSAQVRVLLDNVAPGLIVNENISVELDGASVSVKSSSKTSKAILMAEVVSQAGTPAGGLQQITSTIHLTAIPTADIAAPLAGLKIVTLNDKGEVVLEVKGLAQPELFGLKVSLKDPVFLGKDDLIAENELAVKAIQTVKSGSVTRLSFNLKDIGADVGALAKGKYRVTLKLKSLLNEGAIVNRQSLPAELHKEVSDTFKKK